MPRFSDIVMDHFQDPQNRGPLPERTHLGVIGRPGEGPFFVLNLRVEDEVVRQATFDCNACGATIASGSVLTEWLIGRPLSECETFTTEQLIELLGGLPPDKHHCPVTAITALHQAVSQDHSLPHSSRFLQDT